MNSIEALRGEEYLETVQAMAMAAAEVGRKVMCAFCITKPARYVGMQECGQPGGPCCEDCLLDQRKWTDTAFSIADARPYCRHCDRDTLRGHVYAVTLFTGDRVEI